MENSPLLFMLLISWGVVTGVLVIMLIYRGTLEAHEDDQVFLDAAEAKMAGEQRELVARIEKLTRPIRVLMILSGALLVATAGIWLWKAFQSF
ncbi:MAG: hypothetical protein ACRD50_03800 [Candidatus Acidiferrales bacterium]